jgi:hypothetical protein
LFRSEKWCVSWYLCCSPEHMFVTFGGLRPQVSLPTECACLQGYTMFNYSLSSLLRISLIQNPVHQSSSLCPFLLLCSRYSKNPIT